MPLEAPVISRTGSSAIGSPRYPNADRHNRGRPMDPDRKRKIRLVVALTAAVLLACALVYTSFSASSETKQPSDLQGVTGGNYELTGKVDVDSVSHEGTELRFEV